MSYLRIDLDWKKKKSMMQDYSYITDFVKVLRTYNMLKQANKDWGIYPTQNFKSNKNKHLSKYFRPQRININQISQLRFTKQDFITFHSDHYLEFSESLMQKLNIHEYDRVILYINPKNKRIGFKFYLNKSYQQRKKSCLHSSAVLDAIKHNPQLYHDSSQDIHFGYVIYNNKRIFNDFTFEKQYIIQITRILQQHSWIKQMQHYQPQFDYIHNRWEVQL